MNELKRLEAQRDDEIEIDLGEIFHLLLNKIWVIILCFIVGGVIGFAGTKILVTPQYSASSMIYILPKTRSVTSLADIKMGSQLTSDFGILAKSRPVIEEVNKNLKLDYSYEQLASMVQATNQSDTRILRFTVTDTDPIEAKKIANELANRRSWKRRLFRNPHLHQTQRRMQVSWLLCLLLRQQQSLYSDIC